MHRFDKLITVTLHAAIDVIVDIPQITRETDVLDSRETRLVAAGKGVNVARTLAALDHYVTAIVITGKDTASFFENLESRNIEAHVIASTEQTRVNVTLRNPQQTVHVRSQASQLTGRDFEQVHNTIAVTAPRPSLIAVSGSLPSGTSVAPFFELLRGLINFGHYVIVDTSGKALDAAIQAGASLIKPNLAELEEQAGHELPSSSDILGAMQDLRHKGAKNVVCSLGRAGALLLADSGTTAHLSGRPIGSPASDVGAGDSMVGGIMSIMLAGENLADAVRFGMACASSGLMIPSPGVIDPTLIKGFLDEIQSVSPA